MLHQLECLGPRADFLGDAVQLVIKDIAQPLGEDERKNVSLYFGASFAPRMEHAASQIQDSSDLSLDSGLRTSVRNPELPPFDFVWLIVFFRRAILPFLFQRMRTGYGGPGVGNYSLRNW